MESATVAPAEGLGQTPADSSTLDAQDTLLIWEAVLASNAVIEFDLDGIVLNANENFTKLVGYPKEALIGQHHSKLVAPEEKTSESYTEFWQTLRKGQFFRGECRRIKSDGSDIWLEATYNPVLNEEGKPTKVVKIATDVTATKNHLAALNSVTTALDRSLAVIEFNPDGTIRKANDIFLQVMGYSLKEVIGKHHQMFVEKEEAESDGYREFWEALRRGECQRAQFRRINKTGNEVWLEAAYNPILDARGQLAAVLKFAYDITETYNQATSKISEKTAELEVALEESRNAEKARLDTLEALQKMSTPVTEVWDGILLLPVVGIVDSNRSEDIMASVLSGIKESQAKEFILDISGVGVVDTAVANYFINIAKAASLMGCRTTISGISPDIAITMTQLGIETGNLSTTSTMMNALTGALKQLGMELRTLSIR